MRKRKPVEAPEPSASRHRDIYAETVAALAHDPLRGRQPAPQREADTAPERSEQ